MKFKSAVFAATFLTSLTWACSSNIVMAQESQPTVSGEGKRLAVVCSNFKPKRVISWNESTQKWCDTQFEDFCGERRLSAARAVCSKSYDKRLEQFAIEKGANQPEVVASEKQSGSQSLPLSESRQRIDLQTELLEIEQSLLEIREKKLALKRRAAELTSL